VICSVVNATRKSSFASCARADVKCSSATVSLPERSSHVARLRQWYYLATPAKDEVKQRELTQRACTLGSYAACARLERGERTDRYKDLCEEEPEACTSATNADSSTRDDWLFQRCAAGWVSSCEALTTTLRRGKTTTPQRAQARATWLESGCLEGSAGSCAALSSGPFAPAAPSARVLTTGCELGVATSCTKLAERAEASGDRAAQLQYLERACPVATPQGQISTSRSACRLAGLMYRDGVGAPRDPARAAILLQKGCLQKRYVMDGEACVALGAMYENGIGLPRSLSRAVDLYAAGCADELYDGQNHSRAETRAERGGPKPPPRPPPKQPTACARLRQWIPPPKRE